MDVGDDTATGNGSFDQSIKLLVSSDCEQQVSWRDSLNLQVLRGVACKLKHLCGQVFEDSGTVHGGSGADSAVSTDAGFQESMNSSDWEL